MITPEMTIGEVVGEYPITLGIFARYRMLALVKKHSDWPMGFLIDRCRKPLDFIVVDYLIKELNAIIRKKEEFEGKLRPEISGPLGFDSPFQKIIDEYPSVRNFFAKRGILKFGINYGSSFPLYYYALILRRRPLQLVNELNRLIESAQLALPARGPAALALPVGAEPPGNPKILYLALVAFFFCFAIWALYAPLGPYFMKWYNLSAGQVLILAATPALLGSVLRIPMGILADKYGGRVVFAILLFFVIFPLVGAIFVDSYIMFLICGLFFGMAGTSFIIGITHVSNWYPQSKQGTALGIYGIGNIGTILATIFVPILINSVFGDPAAGPPKIMVGSLEGWRLIFGIYAIPALILGIVYWIVTSEPPTRPKAKSFGEIFGVYKSSGLAWIFAYLYWITFGGFVFFALFSPTYFSDRWGIDRAQASMIYTTIFVFITALIRSFGGWLSDRINPRKILIVVYGVSLVLLLVMAAEISFLLQIGCLYALGMCCGIGNACVFKLIPSYFTAVGAVGGLAGALGGAGGFFMPIIMGMIKDMTGSYVYGFMIWAVMILGTLVVVLIPKIFRKERV